jgi:hypothetical protein
LAVKAAVAMDYKSVRAITEHKILVVVAEPQQAVAMAEQVGAE